MFPVWTVNWSSWSKDPGRPFTPQVQAPSPRVTSSYVRHLTESPLEAIEGIWVFPTPASIFTWISSPLKSWPSLTPFYAGPARHPSGGASPVPTWKSVFPFIISIHPHLQLWNRIISRDSFQIWYLSFSVPHSLIHSPQNRHIPPNWQWPFPFWSSPLKWSTYKPIYPWMVSEVYFLSVCHGGSMLHKLRKGLHFRSDGLSPSLLLVALYSRMCMCTHVPFTSGP